MRRDEEETPTTILVAKHRQSKMPRSWRVPRKGDCEASLAMEGLRGFGLVPGQPVILKCDNERAIVALRKRVAELWGGGALDQAPAPGEHESNGIIENGVKVGKGMLRVLLFALEAKIQGRIPCTLAIFAWLVGHASEVVAKCLRGKDGKTPYSRLFGKEAQVHDLEFGERLRWRSDRGPGHGVLLEARWHTGVWLGRHWNGPTHYVYDPVSKTVKDVRAVQRLPQSERWSFSPRCGKAEVA